ncbi:hypothetical protein EVAR_5739_1 [Eumeta japonica]|uniref:Uncharacterized protein n=1 Tax=Eumeta variegata TaxID=151549 RepID=A0A4C1T467_EUMVA|nr:hypothetical protein EVAR_5739_1 [Eumeta japonica]
MKRTNAVKAAENDGVRSETLSVGYTIMYQLFNKRRKSHGIPDGWFKDFIISLSEGKSSWQVYLNYRIITLLSVIDKIIIERIEKQTERKIWDV